MKAVVAAFVSLLLAGCAQFGPTKTLAPAFAQAAAGKYEISIERDTHFGYNRTPMIVFVDGKAAAQVLGGETINLYVPEGRHAVGITSRIYPKSPKPDMALTVDAGPHDQPILRASLCAIGYCGAKLERVATK